MCQPIAFVAPRGSECIKDDSHLWSGYVRKTANLAARHLKTLDKRVSLGEEILTYVHGLVKGRSRLDAKK